MTTYDNDDTKFVQMSALIGRTFTKHTVTDDELLLEDGAGTFRFFHSQSCCETVYIESIVGDLDDLIGAPILSAEESTNSDTDPEGFTPPEYKPESFTWTFYKLATRKGYVDIRWYGTSNGWYGESVSLTFTPHN